eukprot:355232-Chlamydomonas_euryale.AAC.9
MDWVNSARCSRWGEVESSAVMCHPALREIPLQCCIGCVPLGYMQQWDDGQQGDDGDGLVVWTQS